MIEKPSVTERFFVFNPLSWERTDYADYQFAGADPVYVVDLENAQEAPSQFVTKDGKRWLRILADNVPSVGYKVYEIRNGEGQSFSSAASVSGGQLENKFLRVVVNGRGAITSLEDKKRGRELAAELDGRVINDLGLGAGNLQLESEGPVSVTLLAIAGRPLAHTTRITLFRESERLEIQNNITQNFDATHTWAFGFSVIKPTIYHEEVGAILRARLTQDGGHYSPRNSRYDWLTLNHFADINAQDGFGVTLSNADCYFMKLGNSTVGELDARSPQISILVGGRDMNGEGILTGQGGDEHFLQRFALKAHDEYDSAAAMRFALEHQNPFVTGQVAGGSDYPEKSYSLLSIDDPDVLLWALKPADDGLESGVVARVWNLSSQNRAFAMSLNEGGMSAALSLTHIETPIGVAAVEDGKLTDAINPQQIKTYAIFPSHLPYVPDVTGLSSATTTPMAQSNATSRVDESGTTSADKSTETPPAIATPFATPSPTGKGCLLGLLDELSGLFKRT